MRFLIRLWFSLSSLALTGFASVSAASAQGTSVDPNTAYFWRGLAETLRQDLQEGSLRMADLHAIQLRLALMGVRSQKMEDGIRAIEQHPETDRKQPQMTTGLLPDTEKLIQALDEPNLDVARKYAGQLAAQIHAQYSVYVQKEAESATSGDAEIDKYDRLSMKLWESLQNGDIARAAVLAIEVQNSEKALLASKKRFAINTSNVYDINDALGKAAFLSKDYTAACDYLLKAADNPRGDPALSTFGPELWLARALLRAGYRDVVVTFLERCKNFWDSPRLDEWISSIQNGGSPDFRPNIRDHEPVVSQ